MAKVYTVSLCEKELISWLESRRADNSISPSLIFRDAMKEKKREWDMLQSENPKILHERIKELKKHIGEFSEFLQANGKAQEDFMKFMEEKDNGKFQGQILQEKPMEVMV